MNRPNSPEYITSDFIKYLRKFQTGGGQMLLRCSDCTSSLLEVPHLCVKCLD